MAVTREIAQRDMERPLDGVRTATPVFSGDVPAIHAARLLRAAVEDARLIIQEYQRDAMVTKLSMMAAQITINIDNALDHANRAGITRAKAVDGSE